MNYIVNTSDNEGKTSYALIDGAEILKSVITEDGQSITCPATNTKDVNNDCVVNIQDLVLVATNFGCRGTMERMLMWMERSISYKPYLGRTGDDLCPFLYILDTHSIYIISPYLQ